MNVFMCRGWYENNLAQWTMRVCDYLVDRLGWSFIVCSLCNDGEYGQLRTQQLIFRYEGDKRDMPVSAIDLKNLQPLDWADTPFPTYWTIPKVVARTKIYEVATCEKSEIDELQTMMDQTFKRVLTRDRAPDDDAPEDEEMPYRLEVVTAFRSEHAWLHHRYFQKRSGADPPEESFPVKTMGCLDDHLQSGDAYLFHGTNPSAAWSIMKGGFVLRHAGSATGTMYGNGIYMAECSSKSDEYGRDDGGNTYPGLNALLVCRCFVGKPYVVDKAGDHVSAAQDAGFDCVCGDRESAAAKTYREFVFFDEAQIYPEYTVIYRRQWLADKVPEGMDVEKARGTTGRFWQMRGDIFGFRGWKNVPTEVNKILLALVAKGEASRSIPLRGSNYVFNVETKTVSNEEGKTAPLRPPMQ